MTQPTPEEPQGPPLDSPRPTGPAYPGAPPPGYGPPPPLPAAARSRQTAGVLGILAGGFGVHRFYLGYTSVGVLQILVSIATCGLGGFWGFTEGILLLRGKGIYFDADGRPLGP